VELEHEGDVFEEQPARTSAAVEKALEYFGDESGLTAGDARSAASLAQVLARETRGQEVDMGYRTEGADVGVDLGFEVRCEYALCGGVDLAEQLRAMARAGEAEFDAADAGEEASDGQ
jgi:hypothetical protein